MKKLLHASYFVLLVFCICITVAETTGLVRYGVVGDIIVLPCKHNASAKEQRWRRDSTFLSFGMYINTNVLDTARFKIIGDLNIGEYNLQISNARLEDFGTYWCEIQIKEHVSRRKVVLDYIGFTVDSNEYSSKSYDSSRIQFDNKDSSSPGYGTNVTAEKETGSNANQYYIYSSIAVGLVLVLCLSIRIYNRRRVKSAQNERKSVIQNTNEGHVNENTNTMASNDENAYFTNYELIDENNMIELSNLNFQIRTSNRTARKTSLSFSDRKYFEVVDGKDHSLPSHVNNRQKSYISENSFTLKEESSNLNSYASTEKHANCVLNSFIKTNDNPFKSIRTVSIDRSTSSKSGQSTSSEEPDVVTSKHNSEYLNPYAFLNINEVAIYHSYGTLVTIAPMEGFDNIVKLSLQHKRYSYP